MKTLAEIHTIDGQSIKIDCELSYHSLVKGCSDDTAHFLRIYCDDRIRFIPIHRIEEVIIYVEEVSS